MFHRVAKNSKPRSESSEAVTKPPKPGRERLQHFSDEIANAQNAIEDLEQRVSRFGSIISEAETAERALQSAIHIDGGIALAAYSSGQANPNDEISKLVAHAKSSGEAATAAKIAKPHTESLLQNARSQLVHLTEQRAAELARVLAMLADIDGRAYQETFDRLGKLHDRLVGFCAVAEGTQGEIYLLHEPLKANRFALPSSGNSDADPFLRHRPSEITINESARAWTAIRDRLQADADADLTDLMV